MDVPYCIVKGKARLGQVVHKKTATVLAFTDVKKEDQTSFNKLTESIRNNFNERADTVRYCLFFLLLPFLSLFAVVVRHVDAFRGTMLGVVEVLHLLVFVLCLPYFLTLFFLPSLHSFFLLFPGQQFRKTWGGGIMGSKTIHKVAMYEKNRLRELAAREGK